MTHSTYLTHLTYLTTGSHIPIPAQFLERILALLVLRPPGALGSLRLAQFGDNFAHGACIRFYRKRARRTAEAAVALVFPIGEVKRDNGNVFAFDIFPDVQFSPVKQRMNSNVRPFFKISLE